MARKERAKELEKLPPAESLQRQIDDIGITIDLLTRHKTKLETDKANL